MKITVLKPIGFCSGVRNAISLARKAKQDYPRKRIIIIGYLVHNVGLVQELAKEGIETFYDEDLSDEKLVEAIPYGAVCVFPLHGHDEKLEEICRRKGIVIVDAICPKIKILFDKIKEEVNAGHQVIYVGKHKHDETMNAQRISKDVLVYDIDEKFDYLDVIDAYPCVLDQSSYNINRFKTIHDDIVSCIPNARFGPEVCNSARLREESIQNLSSSVDTIIVIGDDTSSNTSRLFETCKTSHPNATTILISSVNEIDDSLFKNKKHVAITSGSATTLGVIEAVINHIKNIKD